MSMSAETTTSIGDRVDDVDWTAAWMLTGAAPQRPAAGVAAAVVSLVAGLGGRLGGLLRGGLLVAHPGVCSALG